CPLARPRHAGLARRRFPVRRRFDARQVPAPAGVAAAGIGTRPESGRPVLRRRACAPWRGQSQRMVSMKTRFAVLVLAALFATAAHAAPVPLGTVVKAPDWTAGSEWHYSDGYAVKVNSVSAKGAMFERLDAPGQWFMRQGFIKTDSASSTATRNAIYRTVPDTAGLSLSAGKPLTFQREYLNNGKLLVHASSWTVEGRETITVPAGSFDCWVIVWRTRSMKSDWTGFERWWYSPQAQNYVRM